MKRKGVILLSLVLSLNIFASAYAEEAIESGKENPAKQLEAKSTKTVNADLENAIKIAKSKFEIPIDYTEFNSDISGDKDNSLYMLHWYKKASEYSSRGGSINITVDSKGNITNYGNYKDDKGQQNGDTEISEEEALDKAKKFVNYVGLDIAQDISYKNENTYLDEGGRNRNYRFVREYKGVPFNENYVSISINSYTGEIQNYERVWTYDVEFPDKKDVISIEEAQKKYKESIGIHLCYKLKWDQNGESSTYLEYSPKTINMNSAINALTSEKIDNISSYRPYDYMRSKGGFGSTLMSKSYEDVKLSPEELKEVDNTQKLISVEEAIAKLKGIAEFGVDDTCKVESFYYYNNKINQKTVYSLSLNISKPKIFKNQKDKDGKLSSSGNMDSINVTMDAKTYEITSFNSYNYDNESQNSEKKLTGEQVKNLAQEFLKKYVPEKFSNMELVDSLSVEELIKLGYKADSSVSFLRKVNGIPLDDNGARLEYDLKSGKLINYYLTWGEYNFSKVEGIIDLDAAYNAFYEKCGLKLYYMAETSVEERMYKKVNPSKKPILVYMPSLNKPRAIDAKSGALLTSDGEEYFGESNGFDDIENHWAQKQIKSLLDGGYLVYEKSFNPDSMITQKYLVAMLARFDGMPMVKKIENLDGVGFDTYFKRVANGKIVDDTEKNPDSFVTRETAAKYIIRSKGYKKYAEIDGIFKCNFIDKDQIDEKLLGYVAIAGAMKIVSGDIDGAFMPKKNLTKAEAAVMFYNLLKTRY